MHFPIKFCSFPTEWKCNMFIYTQCQEGKWNDVDRTQTLAREWIVRNLVIVYKFQKHKIYIIWNSIFWHKHNRVYFHPQDGKCDAKNVPPVKCFRLTPKLFIKNLHILLICDDDDDNDDDCHRRSGGRWRRGMDGAVAMAVITISSYCCTDKNSS